MNFRFSKSQNFYPSGFWEFEHPKWQSVFIAQNELPMDLPSACGCLNDSYMPAGCRHLFFSFAGRSGSLDWPRILIISSILAHRSLFSVPKCPMNSENKFWQYFFIFPTIKYFWWLESTRGVSNAPVSVLSVYYGLKGFSHCRSLAWMTEPARSGKFCQYLFVI